MFKLNTVTVKNKIALTIGENMQNNKTFKNRKLILAVALVLVVAIFSATLSGCGLFKLYNEDDFNNLMTELAVTMFTGDGLSVNILLDNPEKLGLAGQPASLPTPIFDKSDYESNMRGIMEIVEIFELVNYKKLSTKAKRDYDTVVEYFTTYAGYADFYYLDNRDYIGANDGWNVLLPLYLDKLAFKEENDVVNWISLVEQTTHAFSEYARFEKEVLIPAGYARGSSVYGSIADQCRAIAESPDGEDHFLLAIFKEKIRAVTFLTVSARETYIQKATEKIYENLVPAYIALADEMETLSHCDYTMKPLAEYSEGKAYYELLFRDNSSSSDSVETAYNNLKTAFNETIAEARTLSEGLEDGFELPVNMSMEALQSYYNQLSAKYVEDFPALNEETPDATFFAVPDAMADFYNPASYFKSAVDSTTAPETIYVNSANAGGYLGFDIISHEGLPGHMLQHSYFKSSGANMLRSLLGYTGYAEGWASYAQYYSAKYFEGTDQEKLAYEVECLLDKATTYLYTIIDIEINYFGKSKEALYQDEIYSQIFSDRMYDYMVQNPAVYSSYGYGNYKMEELKKAFNGRDYDFHLYVLSAGPTTYEILRKYM